MFVKEQTAKNKQNKIVSAFRPPSRLKVLEKLTTYLLTPIFPNVLVRDTSGRIQARSFLCSGLLIQSSQYLSRKQTNKQIHCSRLKMCRLILKNTLLTIWAILVLTRPTTLSLSSNLTPGKNHCDTEVCFPAARPLNWLCRCHSMQTRTTEKNPSSITGMSRRNRKRNRGPHLDRLYR